MENNLKSTVGSVLVVENEPFMLEAIEDILDSVGIKVFSATDGHAGIATYIDNKDKIELVILDMRLPGLAGPEILEMLRSINPFVKVIIASGYEKHEVERQLKRQTTDYFLRKPYDAQSLLSTVQSVLGH